MSMETWAPEYPTIKPSRMVDLVQRMRAGHKCKCNTFYLVDASTETCSIFSVDLRFTDEEEAFRERVRRWLDQHLAGDFAVLRGRGGPGDEHAHIELRRAWEQFLARSGFTCLSWPREHGGAGLTLPEQVL